MENLNVSSIFPDLHTYGNENERDTTDDTLNITWFMIWEITDHRY